MKIIDTFDGIESCYDDGEFKKSLWCNYMNVYLPFAKKIVEHVGGKYDFENDILPVLNNIPVQKEKLFEAHNSFCELVDGIDEKVKSALGAELDVTVVFYLGLCCGAGWAVENLKGKKYVLLGAEKIVELDWCDKAQMAGLIYHEIGHLWHFQTRKKLVRKFKNDYLLQLYTEGMAMYAQQELIGDGNFYHQDKDGWLNWCDENKQALFAEYLRRIDNKESCQDFFGDWCNYLGHSDLGYYLGCEMIKNLKKTHTQKELVSLTEKAVYSELKRCAGD